jgi:hypothetical protein
LDLKLLNHLATTGDAFMIEMKGGGAKGQKIVYVANCMGGEGRSGARDWREGILVWFLTLL